MLRAIVVLLLLTLTLGGCAVTASKQPVTERWRVFALQPGTSDFGNYAVLLDTQTGETWVSREGREWKSISR